MFDYSSRLERARALMADRGIDCLLVSVGADLPYLTGYEAMPLERLTMLVVPSTGDAVLIVPELEAPRVPPGPFEIRPWAEGGDPIRAVSSAARRPAVAGIGDHTWSVFLLELLSVMSDTTFVPASLLTRELRAVKEAAEVEALRFAASAVDRVSERIPSGVRFAGRTERDVARDVTEMTLAEGHDQALFWIVASGPNAASPHHEPGGRVIEDGDVVVVDFGGRYQGYCSDTTRTFVVGGPSPELAEVHALVAASQEAGRNAARAGVTAESVDRAARRVIEHAGYGDRFIHRLGHGIGLEGHEHPYIIEGNTAELVPGNAFSIEPGIYLPGKLGVRIEDIAVIAPDGTLDVLNNADRGLRSVS
jgi:Xaa-Pro aminopeptidase